MTIRRISSLEHDINIQKQTGDKYGKQFQRNNPKTAPVHLELFLFELQIEHQIPSDTS